MSATDRVLRRFTDHIVVCDGAMGSELLHRLPPGDHLDLAPVNHPEMVRQIHLDYLNAGAEVIETATFAAGRPRLDRHRDGDLFEKVNSTAVKLARDARDSAGVDCLVAGSIGPLAGVIDLDGSAGRTLIASAHEEQASILAGRGVDLIILETFFRRDELELAISAVRTATDLPLIGMLTFPAERPPHEYSKQARELQLLAEEDLLAVGINCTPGPYETLAILEQVADDVPLVVMPNAGVLVRRNDRLLLPPATPAYLAGFAREAARLGAVMVGGCCGTGPEHIHAIADAVAGITPQTRRARGGARISVAPPETTSRPRRPDSRFAESLAEDRFVRVVQFDPPKGTNPERLVNVAQRLHDHGGVDAVDVNSNPLARLRMDSLWVAAEIQRQAAIETVPHVTPRDASLMGLESQLLGAWHAGIRNLLVITGDPSQLGDYPGVHDVYHVDVFELVRALSRLAEGFDCAGRSIGNPPAFCIGVAVNPNAEDLEHEIERFHQKVEAGAHFAMSQVLFEWGPWERFLKLCGGAPPIPVLAPVWPVTSLRLALRLHHEVPGIVVPESFLDRLEAAGGDAAKVGWDRAAELLHEAPEHGAAGVYLIAPFKNPDEVLKLL